MSANVDWLAENWTTVALAVFIIAIAQLLKLWLSGGGRAARTAMFRARGKPFLDPTAFQPLTLVTKQQLTHNTVRMKFDLPRQDQRLGLPIGQHITFLAKDSDGKDVYRPYTPVTDDDTLGSVTFVIKLYPLGKMSQALAHLQVGQTLPMKGPRGRFKYERNMKKHIGMLAGGTGITPMYQVAVAILKDARDTTRISLISANIAEEDILLREELDALAASSNGRFKVYYVLNVAPEGWSSGVGFISVDMIQQHLPAPGPDTMVLRCGPGPMMDAMQKHLNTLGYPEDSQFAF